MSNGRREESPYTRRLRDVVAYARSIDSYRVGEAWSESDWDITTLVIESQSRTAHNGTRRFLVRFRQFRPASARSRQVGIPFDEPFADFAKAFLTLQRHLRDLRPGNEDLRALKCLYEVLQARETSDPTQFTRSDFEAAADIDEERYSKHCGYELHLLANFIDKYALTPTPISWNNRWGDSRPDRYRHILEGVDDDRMPPRYALQALGELSQESLDDADLLLFRIIQLLVIGGFRIGEVLSLPVDCWVERTYPDPITGKIETRSGIRYWPEKGGETSVKWLPTIAVEVARIAVQDLERLCAEARLQAATIEQTPERIPLPQGYSGEVITAKELGRILGIAAPNITLKQLGVKSAFTEAVSRSVERQFFKVDEIERSLNKYRPRLSIVAGGGEHQKLSESLCVTFRNAHGGKRPNKALPRLVPAGDVRTALGAIAGRESEVESTLRNYIAEKRALGQAIPVHDRGGRKGQPHLALIAKELGSPKLSGCRSGVLMLYAAVGCAKAAWTRFANSLFEKYGKAGPDGAPIKIRPHQLRHWVNTLAERGGAAGGMTLIEMSIWFNRKDVDQTLEYLHLDLPSRLRWLEREIDAGSLAGPFIDAVRSIADPEQRREFIRVHAGRIHVTPYGLCVHDFDTAPCPFHLLCVKGCKMFVRIKGHKEQRDAIETLLNFEEEKLAELEHQDAAENWIIDAKTTRDGCRRALAVDDDDSVADGTHVRVFPDGECLGEPVT
jgi:hypothetical protein